jgi:peptide deformylase
MVRDIVKITDENGEQILSTPCERVSVKEAGPIVQDLMDTLKYHNDLYDKGETDKHCCGLAANQIGINKAVFVYQLPNGKFSHMINPTITRKSKECTMSTEGCMSMDGEKTVTRNNVIEVFYQQLGSNRTYKDRILGFTAIEVQHEMDHLKGILI